MIRIMKKNGVTSLVLAVLLLFSGCSSGENEGGEAPVTLQVSGDRTATVELSYIYAADFTTDPAERKFSVTFSPGPNSTGFPNLQFNVRKVSDPVGTHDGNPSTPTVDSADISLAFGAGGSDFYDTYDDGNFSVTITEFSRDDGISGSFTIADGGVLKTIDGAEISVSPATLSFSCSFVAEPLVDPPYLPTPEPIQ